MSSFFKNKNKTVRKPSVDFHDLYKNIRFSKSEIIDLEKKSHTLLTLNFSIFFLFC